MPNNPPALTDEMADAFAPFLDLAHQKGAWGVVSKALDDMAPITVTVTKGQMKAAIAAHTAWHIDKEQNNG